MKNEKSASKFIQCIVNPAILTYALLAVFIPGVSTIVIAGIYLVITGYSFAFFSFFYSGVYFYEVFKYYSFTEYSGTDMNYYS